MSAAGCAANDCDATLDDTALFCAPHWAMVPASLRDAIAPPGRPPDCDGPYVAAAIAEIAHKERREKARTRSKKLTKPVQLTLF